MRIATLVAIFAIALCLLRAEESRAQGPGIQALRGRLQDKSAEIRIEAAQGLSRVGGRQAVIILRDGLADKDADVRMAVVEALGFIGGRLALTVLSEALKDKAPQVRIRAVEALKDAGTVSAIPIIAKAFEDKERAVRLRAALVLRRIGHRSGVPVRQRCPQRQRSVCQGRSHETSGQGRSEGSQVCWPPRQDTGGQGTGCAHAGC